MCTFCVQPGSKGRICCVSSVPSGCLKRGLGVPWASPGLLLAPGVLEAHLRVAQQPGPYTWPYVHVVFVDQELDSALDSVWPLEAFGL